MEITEGPNMETEKSGAFQHREILLPRRDAEAAVLFIHGFLGSPLQFEDLCQAVYQKGYAAYALLLPGHGGSSTQFARTRLLSLIHISPSPPRCR